MMTFLKSQSQKLTAIGFVSILLLAFQNCSFAAAPNLNFGVAKLNGNGTGYDGKPYGSYGNCNGTVALKSKIVVATDGTVSLVRANCQDLTVPQVVDSKNLKYSGYDSNVFVFDAAIFDAIADSMSNVHFTRAICWNGTGNDGEAGIFADSESFASGSPTTEFKGYAMSNATSSPTYVTGIEETDNADGSIDFQARSTSTTSSPSGGYSMPTYSLNVSSGGGGTCSGSGGGSAMPVVNGGAGSNSLSCLSQPMPNSLITTGTL